MFVNDHISATAGDCEACSYRRSSTKAGVWNNDVDSLSQNKYKSGVQNHMHTEPIICVEYTDS